MLSYGGSPDLSFGAGGYRPIDISGHSGNQDNASAAQSDGKIVVVGASQLSTVSHIIRSDWFVARFTEDGDLDSTFGDDGRSTPGVTFFRDDRDDIRTFGIASADAVAIQSDGKIVVAGNIAITENSGDGTGTVAKVARLNADGSIDSTFGVGGVVTLGTAGAGDNRLDFARAVAVLPGGAIIVSGAAGPVAGRYAPAIQRLNPDGSVDASFGLGGLAIVALSEGYRSDFNTGEPSFAPLVAQSDGMMIIEATVRPIGAPSPSEIVVTRFDTSGSPDPAFGIGGREVINAQSVASDAKSVTAQSMAIQPDGKIVLGGSSSSSDSPPDYHYQLLALRLTTGGHPDPSFGIGGFDVLGGVMPDGSVGGAIAFQPDGKIVIGDRGLLAFARLNADGLPDTGFGTGGTSVIPNLSGLRGGGSVGLAIEPDGKIISTTAFFNQTLIRMLGGGASGDYDNDGISDPAILITTPTILIPISTVVIQPSGGGSADFTPIGDSGPGLTLPAPGAYDGGGVSEVAVYRTGIGAFEVRPYDGGPAVVTPFGTPGFDKSYPAPGDYDHSGKTELAVYLPEFGCFAYRPASGGPDVSVAIGMAGRSVAFSMGTNAVAESGFSTFVPGDYYGSNGASVVTHYSRTGAILDTFRVTGPSAAGGIQGIVFNPDDGLLYASSSTQDRRLTVLAMNSLGVIQQTYTTNSVTGGNGNYGHIAFDSNGHFYVGDNAGVHKFTVGITDSSEVIYDLSSNGVLSLASLPDGNLIVAGDYEITEISNTGDTVERFNPAISILGFSNFRGLAFDPSTGSLYLSMLGDSLAEYHFRKFDYATGALLADTQFNDPATVFLTSSGDLLVGARFQAPGLFDSNLHLLSQLEGSAQVFVAQDPPTAGIGSGRRA